MKILVVDDEADVHKLILRHFRQEIRNNEFEFCFASDGTEALEVLTKKGTDGTGLGRSISNDIIRAHGGAISVDSVAGEYAEFIITLPKT